MRILGSIAGLVVVAVVAFGGCDGDRIAPGPREARCRDVCEKAKGCPDATEVDQRFDCFSYCDDIDAAVRDGSCYAKFDRLYGCIDQFGLCAPERDACADRQAALDDCVAEHCSGNPDIDDCTL